MDKFTRIAAIELCGQAVLLIVIAAAFSLFGETTSVSRHDALVYLAIVVSVHLAWTPVAAGHARRRHHREEQQLADIRSRFAARQAQMSA